MDVSKEIAINNFGITLYKLCLMPRASCEFVDPELPNVAQGPKAGRQWPLGNIRQCRVNNFA